MLSGNSIISSSSWISLFSLQSLILMLKVVLKCQKTHLWYANMATHNALVAFIINMNKFKAICDHGNLTKSKSDEKCARTKHLKTSTKFVHSCVSSVVSSCVNLCQVSSSCVKLFQDVSSDVKVL